MNRMIAGDGSKAIYWSDFASLLSAKIGPWSRRDIEGMSVRFGIPTVEIERHIAALPVRHASAARRSGNVVALRPRAPMTRVGRIAHAAALRREIDRDEAASEVDALLRPARMARAARIAAAIRRDDEHK